MPRSEFERFVSIASSLRADYVGDDDRWAGSPFAWIVQRPSRQRGKIGEQLVTGWCEAKGLEVTASGDSEADRVIEGRRVEIKFSTLWKNGTYVFQQFRDQNYEAALCLGVSPFDVHCWVVPKAVLKRHVIGRAPQHAGRSGRDTFWLRVVPSAPPDWIRPLGGSLGDAWRILRQWREERATTKRHRRPRGR